MVLWATAATDATTMGGRVAAALGLSRASSVVMRPWVDASSAMSLSNGSVSPSGSWYTSPSSPHHTVRSECTWRALSGRAVSASTGTPKVSPQGSGAEGQGGARYNGGAPGPPLAQRL